MSDLVSVAYGRNVNLREVNVTGNDAAVRTSRIPGAICFPQHLLYRHIVTSCRTNFRIIK